MQSGALFCDESANYRIPAEPDKNTKVTLRFRTASGDADHVCLVEEPSKKKIEMTLAETEGRFDYYTVEVAVGEEPFLYTFEAGKGGETCRYNRLGPGGEDKPWFAFRLIPGFHVPEWAKGAVMYQIFMDRFCNGNPDNDVVTDEYVYIGYPVTRVENWEEKLSVMDVDRFYGGDLQGVWKKLDYLQNLGVEVIYLNPIFVSPSNHKYDCQDYEHVDPHYAVIKKDGNGLVNAHAGDNARAKKYMIRSAAPENLKASDEFFAQFMQEVHRRGMRVILDGVFNHCGSFNKWMDREKIYERHGGYATGAYGSSHSPYRSFFRFRDAGGWPNNGSYEGWWNHETLPKLNYEESPQLCEYVLKIAKKWLSPPYNVDGWRLDVAADLGHSSEFNHQFWKRFRRAAREANPNALILAEHYGDASPWLAGDEWDTVMNYDAFMEPLSWFLTGMEKHSDAFIEGLYGDGEAFFNTMGYNMSRMPAPSVETAMNELSNHDHSRFLTRTNHAVGRLDFKTAAAASEGINYGIFREAVVIQMTWPGAPTVYYGDEAGLCGWTDPDNRRPYPWGKENLELIEFHRYLIGFRRRNTAFRNGSLKQLAAGYQLIAYARFNRKETGIVVVNNDNKMRYVLLPVWEAGVVSGSVERIMMTGESGYNAGHVTYPVEDGVLKVELGPYCAMIFEEKRP